MHVGEKPYVVTPTGHADLAPKALTIPAMNGMLEQLLPEDSRHALEELGAVEYHLPPQDASPGARYSVVAARGGDDIWIELRRRKEAPAPPPAPPAPEPVAGVVADSEPAELAPRDEPDPETELVADLEASPSVGGIEVAAAAPEEFEIETFRPIGPFEETLTLDSLVLHEPTLEVAVDDPEIIRAPAEEPAPAADVFTLEAVSMRDVEESVRFEHALDQPETTSAAVDGPKPLIQISDAVVPAQSPCVPAPIAELTPGAIAAEATDPGSVIGVFATPPACELTPEPKVEDTAPASDNATDDLEEQEEAEIAVTPHRPAVVPISRPVARAEAPSPRLRGEGLPYLLQLAAAQGASVLYVAAQAKPSLRVDGEIRVLDHETPLTEAQLEAAILALLPAGRQIPVEETETCDVPEVGRVQVLGFRDHRGLGAMFKMLPARAISAEQMGLGAAVQALCTETEGLVLVAGARNSGKSTLVAALVDQINRTRRDHVITIEHQIQYVHENRTSFVSQREARDEELFAGWVRSALREGPDVLVVDQVMSPEAAASALHAASNGHLVIASVTASTTTAALTHFVELFGEHRAEARATLSEHLRGIITQTLLRKTGGGRAAAREVLVNVPSVATLVADGQFEQLAGVLNGGRRVGMVPLNDALLGLVQAGSLDVREAYRKSPDQNELVSMFDRAGLDTTFAERLA